MTDDQHAGTRRPDGSPGARSTSEDPAAGPYPGFPPGYGGPQGMPGWGPGYPPEVWMQQGWNMPGGYAVPPGHGLPPGYHMPPPWPGAAPGYGPPPPHPASMGPPGSAHGDFAAAMGEAAERNGLGMLKGMLNFEDGDFWKGALVGAAVVLLMTNDELRSSLIGGATRTAEAMKSGFAGMAGDTPPETGAQASRTSAGESDEEAPQ